MRIGKAEAAELLKKEKAKRLESFIESIRELARQYPDVEPGFCVMASGQNRFEVHITSFMPGNLISLICEELAENGGGSFVSPIFEDTETRKPN